MSITSIPVIFPPFTGDNTLWQKNVVLWGNRKSSEFLSVGDFGAKGDGITNDTADQGAARAALVSAGGGFLVYAPTAGYLVNSVVRRGGLSYYDPEFPTLREQQRSPLSVFAAATSTAALSGFNTVLISGTVAGTTLTNFIANANQDMVGVSGWVLRGGSGSNFMEAANFGAWMENNTAQTWAVEIDVNNEGATQVEGDSKGGDGIVLNTGSTFSPDMGIKITRAPGAGTGPGWLRGITIDGARNVGLRIEAMDSTTFPNVVPAAPGGIQAIQLKNSSDTNLRWLLDGNGAMSWGNGVSAADVTFARISVSTMRLNANLSMDGALAAIGGITTGGALQDSAVWATTTPTITSGTGIFTTVSCNLRWNQIGKRVFFTSEITITTNGTAATNVICPLPVNNKTTLHQICCGRARGVSGKMLQGDIAGNAITIFNYDNTYPGANGEILTLSGVYEAA